jgi:hypothetical protein
MLYLLILPSGKPVDISLEAIKHGWKEYMQQPALPASLAYVLLYFNVVLTPGSLMTAYLTQHGTSKLFGLLTCNFSEGFITQQSHIGKMSSPHRVCGLKKKKKNPWVLSPTLVSY